MFGDWFKLDTAALIKIEVGSVSIGWLSSILEIHLFNYGISDPGTSELVDLIIRSAIGATTGAAMGLIVHGVWKKLKPKE